MTNLNSTIRIGLLVATTAVVAAAAPAQQLSLSEMSLERWSKLREVERHQMQIAEKYYRESNWKVAADEYDKYLSLYESSDAASYAMLKWSLCHVKLRKQNTAINDGFRSVVDYWPDSADAISARYFIGKTWKDIGQTNKAKSALADVVQQHPKHIVGVYSMVALAGIAETEKDDKRKVELWRKLTFDAVRNKQTARSCNDAASRLAAHQLNVGQLDEAVKALETIYNQQQIVQQVAQRGQSTVRTLMGRSETQSKANAVADQLVGYLRSQQSECSVDEDGKNAAKQIGFMVVDVLRSAKRDDQVKATFQKIAKRFGRDDPLLDRMADWHRSIDQHEQARALYRQFDDRIEGLQRIAASFRQQKNLTSAVATYAELIAADADQSAKWKSELAVTYRESQKWEQAVAIYQELLIEDAKNGDRWLWEIATTYRDGSKWKQAIGFYRQTDRFPQNYQEMSRCHRRLKQTDEAITLYNQIAGGDKSLAPWALLQIGYTHEEAGDKQKAIGAFKKVCKLFPKDRHASTAHAHLQNKYKLSVTLGGAKDD